MNETPYCDDFCPILRKCVKYRLEPNDVVRLSVMINNWEQNKKAMSFFAAVGRVILKFRGSAYG